MRRKFLMQHQHCVVASFFKFYKGVTISLPQPVEGKQYQNFQDHDFFRLSKFPALISVLNRWGKKGGKFQKPEKIVVLKVGLIYFSLQLPIRRSNLESDQTYFLFAALVLTRILKHFPPFTASHLSFSIHVLVNFWLVLKFIYAYGTKVLQKVANRQRNGNLKIYG